MKRFFVLIALLCASTFATAQKADVSFVAGGAFVSESSAPSGITCTSPCPLAFNFNTDTHVFYEGTVAFGRVNFNVLSLYLEFPVAGIPSAHVSFPGLPTSNSIRLSSVFVTPSIRLKFAPAAPLSPFVSIGAGLAHYSVATPATSSGPTANKGAWQFGGGLDIKTKIQLLGFRAEVRDFVTGQPEFTSVSAQAFSSQNNGRRHNVLAGGGIVLQF